MSILNQIPTPSFEFNAGLVDNRGALALVRQGQDITGQVDFPFVRNSVKNVPDKLGILRAVPANEPAVTFDEQGRNLGYFPESARTNLILNSEQFQDWPIFININTTGTPPFVNVAVAPDGTMTADKLIENTSTGQHIIGQTPTIPSGVPHTLSVFAKAAERGFLFLFEDSGGGRSAYFNLQNGTIGTLGGVATAAIQSFGNGWYRCSITLTSTGTLARMRIATATANGTNSYSGDGTSGIFIWGAQVELGAFPTTYIPTVASTVTRPADILTYTDASDFIGQSEGVIYAEVDWVNSIALGRIVTLFNNTSIRIDIRNTSTNQISAVGVSSGVVQFSITSTTFNRIGLGKILLRYESGNVLLYVNGVIVGSNTSANFPFNATLNQIKIGTFVDNTDSFNDPISSLRLWKTTQWLTDDLAKLLTRVPS
jgi:hypothetical protein